MHSQSLNCPCRFHIIGGECNYLLRFSPVTKRLEFVPDQEWMTPCMQQWRQQDIQYVLREAEKLLMDTAYRLRLPVKVHYTPTVCTCRVDHIQLMDTAYRLRLPVKVHYTATMYTCRESATHCFLHVSADTKRGKPEGSGAEGRGGGQRGFGRGGPCVADPWDLSTDQCCTYKHINTLYARQDQICCTVLHAKRLHKSIEVYPRWPLTGPF